MRALLDTQVLIWVLTGHARLSDQLRDGLENPANDIFFSAAAIWEIAIKRALGRIDFLVDPEDALVEAGRAGFAELPVQGRTALRVAKLPLYHRDPFDRLFVVQAMENGLILLTADACLTQYSPLVTLVP